MVSGINIPQIEAKDVLNGYEIKSLKRYKAVLDYSLESKKMQEIHRKVYRNNQFYFVKDNKKYSTDVISITFTYRNDEHSIEQLRELLYRDGFDCDGFHYVRYKRSSGSARIGKCLFIKKELYKPMMKWSLMGLKIKEGDSLDLASMEAYLSLPLSSIIDTVRISPNSILLVDDYESVFSDKVMVTNIDDNKQLVTKVDTIDISNSIWDGESLLDKSVFKEKYADKGMLLLREQFFKSCCFNCDIQQFFKDNDITSISQLNGKTRATDIKDIKIITTPSSIKFLKFGDIDQWFDHLSGLFGIVKYDKPTHYFDGKLVSTHYQLLNTLELDKVAVEKLLEDSFHYIRLLKTDLPTLRLQLKMNIDQDIHYGNISTTNDFIYTMLQINDLIEDTNMFYKFRNDIISSQIRNLRKGHLLVEGNYSTLCGNGYELLLQSIGKFNGESVLKGDKVISYRFASGEDLLGIRSPHVTVGNIWIPKNVRREEYKYFSQSPQILFLNAIDNNIQQKLNGADYDSDTVLLTNDKLLVESAKENVNNFLVPTSKVTSNKTPRKNNAWHKYDLDKKTSVNLIGDIINLSQILNSYMWELKKCGNDYQSVYQDVCTLAIMSNIEIDKAKKEFVINNKKELNKLKTKYTKILGNRPMFFYHLPFDRIIKVGDGDDKKQPTRDITKYRNYETTMDYIEDSITYFQKRNRAKRNPRIQIKDLISTNYTINTKNVDYRQVKRVYAILNKYRDTSLAIWSKTSIENSEKYLLSLNAKKECMNSLKKMTLTIDTIAKIIEKADSSNQRRMLSTLYAVYKKDVIELFNRNIGNVYILVENTGYEEPYTTLYGYEYVCKIMQNLS